MYNLLREIRPYTSARLRLSGMSDQNRVERARESKRMIVDPAMGFPRQERQGNDSNELKCSTIGQDKKDKCRKREINAWIQMNTMHTHVRLRRYSVNSIERQILLLSTSSRSFRGRGKDVKGVGWMDGRSHRRRLAVQSHFQPFSSMGLLQQIQQWHKNLRLNDNRGKSGRTGASDNISMNRVQIDLKSFTRRKNFSIGEWNK